MPEQVLEQILREGLAMRELSADENTLRRFRIYYDNLEAYNRVMNLTAITGEADAARLHFLDCAAAGRSSTWAPARAFPVWF